MTNPELKGVLQEAVGESEEQSVQTVSVDSVLLSVFGLDDAVSVDSVLLSIFDSDDAVSVDSVETVEPVPVTVLPLASVQDASLLLHELPLVISVLELVV